MEFLNQYLAVVSFGLFLASPCVADDAIPSPDQNELSTNNLPRVIGSNLFRLPPLDVEAIYPPVVTALAISNDATKLVAAGDDHAIRIIDTSDPNSIATRLGHSDWVQAIVMENATQRFYSCGNDGELRRWSLQEETPSEVIHRSPTALMALAIDEKNNCLACAGFGPKIWIYSLTDRQLVQELDVPCSDLRTLAFSADGKSLACGSRDGYVRVWDWRGKTLLAEQRLHRDRVRAVRFSHEDSLVTSVGEDRHVVCFDYRQRLITCSRGLATGRLLSMSILDNELIAIAGSDNTIRIVEIQSGDERGELVGHEGSVAVMISHRDILLSGSFDTTIRIWDLTKAKSGASDAKTERFEHPVSARFHDSGINRDPVR